MVNEKILSQVANVLRKDSLEMTTEAGSGHPSSCLSCAEIMSTLFFDEMKYDIKNPFNPDNDEFILSKGHAAPILYSSLFRAGCIKNKLKDLRKLKSPLEGHPVPSSLNWIKVATGSLGQGLSVGVGMAIAAKKQKRKFRTYVLLGDGELAEGSVYEAFELASYYKLDNLIAIIDVNRLGQRGETMLGHNMSKYKKRIDGFGWNTIIINGHNIKQIKKALKQARKSNKPTAIITKTLKGKGVSILENKNNWHGKPLNKEQLQEALKQLPKNEMPKIKIRKNKKINYKPKKIKLTQTIYKEETATRKAYGLALANLAKSNPNIIAIDGEVSNSTYSEEVRKIKPEQFVEAFIAEQNMVGMALGLSVKGFNVFASTFSAFLTRAYDQIRMAGLSSANITFSGSHSGVSIGEDGSSQMGLEDIAMFRNIQDSIVLYPSDAISAEKLTILCSKLKSIKYIRTSRPKTKLIYKKNETFPLGDFKILKQSNKDEVILIGSGITTHEALKAYNELKSKVAVIDIYSIKPFHAEKFKTFVKKHGNKIVIAEDHHPEGGVGEMLAEVISGTNIKLKHLSVKKIPHSGKMQELLKKYKIDSKAYIESVNSIW